jgi:branched-chain amino acid aminotransferase
MEQTAYLNGNWIAAGRLQLPISDLGFMQGVTVAEQLRTFGGQLFQLAPHVERLCRSLAIVGIDLPWSAAEVSAAATELAARNHAMLPAGDDLALCIFVTPGDSPALAPTAAGPRLAMYTVPVPFHSWVGKYELGQIVAVPSIRQVPENCWPAELKCRSRMHYYLADREAAAKVPGARALMLDQDDNVVEATTANVLLYVAGEGLVSPPAGSILRGISASFTKELTTSLGIDYSERTLTVDDLCAADEVLLTSTSPCVLPVVLCGDRPIGTGRPGPVFERLLSAWSDQVGVDVREQTKRFASRR